MIVRGTTPTHGFILPLKAESIEQIYITYLQNDEVILNYTDTDVTIRNVQDFNENASIDEIEVEIENEITDEPEEPCSIASVHLSQADTLKFHFYPAAEKNLAVIQIRVLDKQGEAYASEPVRERIFGVLLDGVIE